MAQDARTVTHLELLQKKLGKLSANATDHNTQVTTGNVQKLSEKLQ